MTAKSSTAEAVIFGNRLMVDLVDLAEISSIEILIFRTISYVDKTKLCLIFPFVGKLNWPS